MKQYRQLLHNNNRGVIAGAFLTTALMLLSSYACSQDTAPRQYGWRLEGDYETTIGAGPATPHTPWARPLAGGPLRVLAICLADASYDVTELQQRLETTLHAMPANSWLHLGQSYWLNIWVEGCTSSERNARVLKWLDEPWDVILLGNYRFASLKPETRVRILSQVSRGAGLVMVYPHEMDDRLISQPIPGAGEDITRGIPFRGMNFYRNIFMPRFEMLETSEIPDRLINAYRFGRGTVLIVNYGTVSSVFDAIPGGLTPYEEFTITSPVQYDYHQSLIVKSILWAAGRQPSLAWSAPFPDGLELTREMMPKPLEIPFHWSGASGRIDWTFRIRNIWNDVELESRLEQYVQPGEGNFTISIPPLEGGLHFVDFITSVNGVPGNWGSFSLRVRPPLAIERIVTEKNLHSLDEPVRGVVYFDNKPQPEGSWSLSLRLEDCYNRTFSRAAVTLASASTHAAFSFPPGQAISRGARLRAQILRGDEPQHEAETEIAFRQPLRGRFPAAMWGALGGYAARAGNILMRDFGFNAVIGNPASLWRDDLGLMTFGGGAGALIHSLGDEITVPMPKQGEAFNKFVQSRYDSIDAVNKAWGTSFAGWDEVTPYLEGHADGPAQYIHHHDSLVAGEEAYANMCRNRRLDIEKENPTGVVGPEGSELGDPDLTLPAVTFWGPYFSERDNLLVTAAGAPDLLRGNWFGGYVADRIKDTRLNYILWRSILGGNNLVEYFCVSGNEGFISTSLTIDPHVERFRPSWDQIRFGLGQLLDAAEPAAGPVALYHSQSSQHASLLGPPAGNTIKVHTAFLNVLGDAGYPASYVTSRQVLEGRLNQGDIRVLCLLHAFALSDGEIRAIENFALGGGVVIADIPPAWMDENCALRPVRGMDAFFGLKQSRPGEPARELEGLALSLTRIAQPGGAGYRLRGVNADLQTDDGAVQYPENSISAVITKAHDKGQSILLNAMPWDDPDTGPDSVAFLKSLLAGAGVEPPFHYTLRQDIRTPGMKSYCYNHGEVRIDAVLPPEESPADIPVIVQMKWREKAHTYDLRERKHLGEIDELEIAVPRSSPLVTARTAHEIRQVKVNVPSTAKAGETIAVSAAAHDSEDKPLPGHVFQMRVIGPDGVERPWYGGILGTLREGDSLSIPFAASDPAGDWEIVITEVISGIEKRTKVSVGSGD